MVVTPRGCRLAIPQLLGPFKWQGMFWCPSPSPRYLYVCVVGCGLLTMSPSPCSLSRAPCAQPHPACEPPRVSGLAGALSGGGAGRPSSRTGPRPLIVPTLPPQGLPTVSLETSELVYLSLDSDMLQLPEGFSIPPIANQAQLREKCVRLHSMSVDMCSSVIVAYALQAA